MIGTDGEKERVKELCYQCDLMIKSDVLILSMYIRWFNFCCLMVNLYSLQILFGYNLAVLSTC